MTSIDTLFSKEGRAILFKIFEELRYEKQMSGFATLSLCWRLCTYERDLFRYSNAEVTVNHPLGIFKGTAFWIAEIVNRFYFSTINSFVYFGAAVLLVIIGIRRFSEQVSDTAVIGGVVFEAILLMLMFVVMFFSPDDTDVSQTSTADSSANNEQIGDLVTEIGEIATDFASVSVQLEELNKNLMDIVEQQRSLIEQVNEVALNTAQAVAPNPELLETMKNTTESLEEFKQTIIDFKQSAEELKKEEIEISVRKELERLLVQTVKQNYEKQ